MPAVMHEIPASYFIFPQNSKRTHDVDELKQQVIDVWHGLRPET